MEYPKCSDSRKCFAKVEDHGKTFCSILNNNYAKRDVGNYEDGKCPFCKPSPKSKVRRAK